MKLGPYTKSTTVSSNLIEFLRADSPGHWSLWVRFVRILLLIDYCRIPNAKESGKTSQVIFPNCENRPSRPHWIAPVPERRLTIFFRSACPVPGQAHTTPKESGGLVNEIGEPGQVQDMLTFKKFQSSCGYRGDPMRAGRPVFAIWENELRGFAGSLAFGILHSKNVGI